MKNVFLLCIILLIFNQNIFSSGSADRLYLIGKRLQNEKNYSDAIIIYNNIIETSGVQNRLWLAAAYFELGNIYYELGNFQQAQDAFSNLIKYYPSHYLVPNAQQMLDKVLKAMSSEKTTEPVQQTPQPIVTHDVSSKLTPAPTSDFNELKTIDDSESGNLSDHYRRILRELTDKSLYDEIKKGNNYFEQSDYNNAYNLFSKLYSENQDNHLVAYNYGITLIKLERFEEAADTLEKVFEKYPNDIDVILNLAYIYQQQNKLLLSRMLWRAALRLDSENKVAKHNLKVLNEKFGL